MASPSSAEAVNTPAAPAFRSAVEMLSNPATLAQRQRDDAYLAQVCKDLSADRSEAGGGRTETPLHLRHYMNDEFAQYAWGPDLGLSESLDAMPKYQSLCIAVDASCRLESCGGSSEA